MNSSFRATKSVSHSNSTIAPIRLVVCIYDCITPRAKITICFFFVQRALLFLAISHELSLCHHRTLQVPLCILRLQCPVSSLSFLIVAMSIIGVCLFMLYGILFFPALHPCFHHLFYCQVLVLPPYCVTPLLYASSTIPRM